MVPFHAGLDKVKDNALALEQPTTAAFNVALDTSNWEVAAIVSPSSCQISYVCSSETTQVLLKYMYQHSYITVSLMALQNAW